MKLKTLIGFIRPESKRYSRRLYREIKYGAPQLGRAIYYLIMKTKYSIIRICLGEDNYIKWLNRER